MTKERPTKRNPSLVGPTVWGFSQVHGSGHPLNLVKALRKFRFEQSD